MGIANIYAEPSFNSAVVTQGILGESLEMLEKRGEWFRVRQWDGYIGWIYYFYVADPPDEWTPNFHYRLRSGWVYDQPAMDAPTLRQITVGVYLPGERVEEHWVKVILPDGLEGFVYDRAVTGTPEALVDKILFTAERFLGTSYVWGGKTPLGFDCSGFVQTVFWLNGIWLERDAHQQAEQGKLIPDRSQLQKGDLVFFKEKERVSHVGIAYDAHRFIHCSGLVKHNSFFPEDALYSDRLDKMYFEAKRVIKP